MSLPEPDARDRDRTFITRKHPRAPSIPSHKTIAKRPLLRPPIPPPRQSEASSQKTIYISARTPFVSAVKRVRSGRAAVLKASGKAIDKALRLGLYFLDAGDEVAIATGTVEVVDDIVEKDEGLKGLGVRRKGKRKRGAEMKEGEEVSMRVRKMSVVEITITLSRKS